jgi:hypothetical protein
MHKFGRFTEAQPKITEWHLTGRTLASPHQA